jgi:hypothetical protein
MLNLFQDILIVVSTVVGSLLFMAIMNRIWPWEKRRSHNDLIGWQLTVLGTAYAVILGFMLYTVWTEFGAADENTDLEASALVNVYGLADGLPEPQRTQVRELARSYADTALHADWPKMLAAQVPNDTVSINDKMWQALMSIKSASPVELVAENHALHQLASLTEHRRVRVLQSNSQLPMVLWFVLLVGGVLTIASSCMFGAESTTLHGLQVFAFSLMISLCLVAIADINRPFQGVIHVSDYAFARAQRDLMSR